MNLNINIRAEALAFVKQHNLPPHVCPLAVIEQAMERGAVIAVEQLTAEIKAIHEELVKAQALSK